MTAPPVLIVPLCAVVAKHCVFLALPVLAPLDASPLLEFYRRRLRSIRLFCEIEVLRLKRFVLCKLPFRRVLVRYSRRLRLVPVACSINLRSIRCFFCLSLIRRFGCLSLSLSLILLALLSLISVGNLTVGGTGNGTGAGQNAAATAVVDYSGVVNAVNVTAGGSTRSR